MWLKGSISTVLNPIFSKKVQGQKHPGRWGIIEHQISGIKVLFKTYTKGHKHPSIRLISKSKTQLVNQRKQKVAFNPGTVHSPEIQSYRTWWGAAPPTLNDTPVVYIYIYIYTHTSYNRTHIRNILSSRRTSKQMIPWAELLWAWLLCRTWILTDITQKTLLMNPYLWIDGFDEELNTEERYFLKTGCSHKVNP